MSEDEVEKVLLQAKKRAEELDLKTVVVASSSGRLVLKLQSYLGDLRLLWLLIALDSLVLMPRN